MKGHGLNIIQWNSPGITSEDILPVTATKHTVAYQKESRQPAVWSMRAAGLRRIVYSIPFCTMRAYYSGVARITRTG